MPAAAAALFSEKEERKVIRKIFGILLSILMMIPVCGQVEETEAEESALSLYAINVGKADSLLLRSGSTAYLIDTGTEDSYPALEKALQAEGITHLDGVILTHTHKDHTGGLEYLLDSDIEIDQVYASGYYNKKEKKHPAVVALKGTGRDVVYLLSGDSLPLDGGTLEVLGPLEADPEKENNNSLVLLATGGGGTMLLAGDMEFPEEQSLMQAGLISHADVLKVGNHGNPDATGNDFLEAVSPKAAVFSTDTNEEPDTPAIRIVTWMKQHGVEIYQTQETESGVLITLQNGEIAAEFK